MKKLTILVSLMALMLCSCASSSRRHLGAWNVIWDEDASATARFADETVDVTTEDETKSYKYVIDYAKTPAWIDVTTEDGLVRGIMEFVDEDTLTIASNEPDEPRPTGFTSAEDIATFKRVKDEK